MNVFNLISYDLKNEIINNKRFIVIPFFTILECMIAEMNITSVKKSFSINNNISFFDLFSSVFKGCDPLSRSLSDWVPIPYLWLSVFIFAMFIVFDYMYNDISQFGLQIISRAGRSKWWLSKCISCIITLTSFYTILIFTIIIFSMIRGFSLLSENSEIINTIANDSMYLKFKNPEGISVYHIIISLLAPLLVMCATGIIQMTMSLFIKPAYSFILMLGVMLSGVFFESTAAYPRCGMILMSDVFFIDGYSTIKGVFLCIFLMFFFSITGVLCIKKYDILLDRE